MSSQKIEDHLPVVKYHGLNTDKTVDLGTAAQTQGKSFNYVGTETGAANAITFTLQDSNSTNVALTAGLVVWVKLGTTFVKDTASTVVMNGTSKSVFNQTNPASNVHTGILSGAIVGIVYDGTQWQMIGY